MLCHSFTQFGHWSCPWKPLFSVLGVKIAMHSVSNIKIITTITPRHKCHYHKQTWALPRSLATLQCALPGLISHEIHCAESDAFDGRNSRALCFQGKQNSRFQSSVANGWQHETQQKNPQTRVKPLYCWSSPMDGWNNSIWQLTTWMINLLNIFQ